MLTDTIQLDRPITCALCVGIDLHKDTMMVCVIDPQTNQTTFDRIPCKCRNQVVEFFQGLKARGPIVVAIEAVGFYRWLWDLLYPIADRLALADATQCRAMAGRKLKTDKEDSLNVAQLLTAGRLPVAYAPPAEVYELRDWTRHRNFLSRQHARCIHRVKSLMNLNNRPGPDALTVASLHRYIEGQGKLLPERHVVQLWQAVHLMALLCEQIDVCERSIDKLLASDRFQAVAAILRSMYGVGPVVAATVLAEVGDFHRFEYRKSIARYAGLNPMIHASADTVRTGRIAKSGPPDLRWAMQQAAWVAIRTDERVKRLYGKISRKAGRKAAAVAIARRMLVWMWHMVKSNQTYKIEERKVAA